ncbi:MAG: hypothetical protein GY866_37465 [Proteobacteria bacterium]|nr:hypothetical protein [Pseudomonadota bacterium]
MAKKLIISTVMVSLLILNTAFGLTRYGDARIKRGSLTIVREGFSSTYDNREEEIEILKNDVLRVGKRSLVVLKTVENATIRMGSNAVFQVRPWKQRKKRGYLRMLYGKARLQVKKIKSRNRFRFKTATATIGVKGTDLDSDVTEDGTTSSGCFEGIYEVENTLTGETTDLTPPKRVISTSNKLSKPFVDTSLEPPKEEKEVMEDAEVVDEKTDVAKSEEEKMVENLEKAPPGSDGSSVVEGTEIALAEGAIDQQDLEFDKKNADVDTQFAEETKVVTEKEVVEKTPEEKEAEKEFDGELKTDEAEVEEVELVTTIAKADLKPEEKSEGDKDADDEKDSQEEVKDSDPPDDVWTPDVSVDGNDDQKTGRVIINFED